MCRNSFAHKCLFSLGDECVHICEHVPEVPMASRSHGMCLVFILTQAKCTGAAGSHHPTEEQAGA